MTEFWFKPKTLGYGAYPTHWKGWALLAGYVAALWLILLLATASTPGAPPATLAQWLVWIALIGLLTFGFLRLARARTDGPWAWRVGSSDESRRR